MFFRKKYRAKHEEIVNQAATLPDYEARVAAAAADALAQGVDPKLVAEYTTKLLRDIELRGRT